MAYISGIQTITINGTPYAPKSGAKIETATLNKEPVVAKSGDIFTKSTPIAQKITFAILIPGSVNPLDFNSLDNAKIVIQTVTGTITANGWTCSGTRSLDTEEGELELEFFGPPLSIVPVPAT